jgi:hypothetical protein
MANTAGDGGALINLMHISEHFNPGIVCVSEFLQFIGITVFFTAIFLLGRMERWNRGMLASGSESLQSLRLGENTGYEKRIKIYSTKIVGSPFYDDARQASIFCFRPRKYANITRKSIPLYSF